MTMEPTMTVMELEPKMHTTTNEALPVFDGGRLIGLIRRPVASEPLGPGRETVYLDRPVGRGTHPAAA